MRSGRVRLMAGAGALVVAVALAGCKSRGPTAEDTSQAPSAAPSAASQDEPTGGAAVAGVAPQAPRGEPVRLGSLAKEPLREVLSKVGRAHYDPVEAGLESLRFALDYTWSRHDVRAKAEGRWRKGELPEVTLLEVAIKGRVDKAPREDKMGKQLWGAIKQGLEEILEGLGRGFLSARLEGWKDAEGEVVLEEDTLILRLDQEGNQYTVNVGPGYAIEQITQRVPPGVERGMRYQYRVEQGRHLVQKATYSVRLDENQTLDDGVKSVARNTDGMTFAFTYANRGGFFLPVQVEKTLPALNERIGLKISYLEVEP